MGTKLQCKLCKDIVESKHVHDGKYCTCGAMFVDGGDEYLRIGGNTNNIIYVETGLTVNEAVQKARKREADNG